MAVCSVKTVAGQDVVKKMKQVILADRVGHHQVIEDARTLWVNDLLLYIGVDIEVLEEYPDDYIKAYLIDNNIDIVYYQDIRACKVFYDNQVIGEWLGPSFVLKKDDGEYYYEITLESWSIQEEEVIEND